LLQPRLAVAENAGDPRRPKAIPNSPEFTADFADGADGREQFPKPPTIRLNEHLRASYAF